MISIVNSKLRFLRPKVVRLATLLYSRENFFELRKKQGAGRANFHF